MKSKSLNRAHFEITHNGDAMSGLVMDRETALKCAFFMPNGWEEGVMGINRGVKSPISSYLFKISIV